jgi:hypothetical protein
LVRRYFECGPADGKVFGEPVDQLVVGGGSGVDERPQGGLEVLGMRSSAATPSNGLNRPGMRAGSEATREAWSHASTEEVSG